MHSRRTEHLRESRKCAYCALTATRLHRGTMERNLKTAPREIYNKIAVCRVVECLRRAEHLAPLLASHSPHGLGRTHAKRFKQPVDGLDVRHGGVIGIVHDGEGEARASRKYPRRCHAQVVPATMLKRSMSRENRSDRSANGMNTMFVVDAPRRSPLPQTAQRAPFAVIGTKAAFAPDALGRNDQAFLQIARVL